MRYEKLVRPLEFNLFKNVTHIVYGSILHHTKISLISKMKRQCFETFCEKSTKICRFGK